MIDDAIQKLTPTQRTIHDLFWLCMLHNRNNGVKALSAESGISLGTVDGTLKRLRGLKLIPTRTSHTKLKPDEWSDDTFLRQFPGWRAMLPTTKKRTFAIETPPSALPSIEELIENKIKRFERIESHNDAVQLMTVRIDVDGPIALMMLGDPHIDDDGCDIVALKRDIDLCNSTEGLYAAHVGDLTNNWVGRLEAKYGDQTTTIEEGAILAKWIINAAPWLFLVLGNHDLWNRGGIYVKELCDQANVFCDAHGVRVQLELPSGKSIRVNCRHDHSGHSMWNPGHGTLKASLFGDDHIYVAGHRHTSANGPAVRDGETGRIKYPLRVAGYKRFDDYARQLGLPDRRISGAAVIVIDPRFDDDDPGMISVFESTIQGVGYLNYCRSEWLRINKQRA